MLLNIYFALPGFKKDNFALISQFVSVDDGTQIFNRGPKQRIIVDL